MNVLFICTANYYRSVTAENIFKKRVSLNVKSAGTHPLAEKVVKREMIDWADKIFVMENFHKEKIIEIVPNSQKKIVILDIPDIYDRNDPKLIRLLKKRVTPHLKRQ